MGTATGLFKNSTKNYSITLVGDDITTGTFDIVGDVVKQTGNQTRSVADIFIPIRSSQLRFTARNSETLFDELGLIKLGDVTITLNNLTDSVVEFIGYVQPQNIEKNQKWAAGDFVLTCFDGLILLQQNTYTLNSTYTLAGFLEAILEPLTVVNKALYVASWQEENMSSTSPALIRFDASVLNAANNYEALEIILKRFGLIITQSHSRDVIEWKIIQRNQIGGDTSGWLIDFSDSSVASQTQTDATTLADADLLSEHIKGKTDSIEDIETIFKWNVADPFILNSSFNQFNRSGLSSWEVKQGTVTQSFPDGNISSTDNAVISQRLNYIKGAGQPFRLDSKFNGTGVSFTINKGTFFYAKVSFIAPLGDSATLYLKDDGTVTTVETSLTYFTPAVQEGFNNLQEISVSLNVTDGNLAFNQDRIVVVDLLFSCLDDETAPRYSSFAWYSIKAVIEETDSFNELSTEINSTNFGGKLNNIFPLSDQTAYNAKGGIEVNDGSTWRLSSDWGTSEALDTVFTRDINRQSKNTLEYYKLKTIPSAFAKRGYSQGFTYSSVVFIPVYELINYTSSSIDLQIIEKTNLLPESLTTRFLSNNADINSSRVAIQDVYLVIKEVLGVVSVTNIQTDVLVEWSDIVVVLQDGTRFSVADGQFAYEIDYRSDQAVEPIVFYYDKARNTILNKNEEAWFNSPEFLEGVNAVELFSVVGNTDADISGDTAAPFVSVFPKQIAQGLFAAKEAQKEATLNEVIWNYRSDFICKIGQDLDGDYTSIAVDPFYPVRVTIPSGSDLKIVSGDKTYQVTTTALVQTGDLSIPIQQAFIVAYKDAVVKYDVAFDGSQVLVQPSQVLVIAQNATADSSAALQLIAGQGTALASLSAEVLGENGNANTAGIKFDVTQIASRSVLQVDTAGNIASISLLSGVTDSSVKINANQIDVNGETTFFAGITRAISEGEITVPDGVSTFFQETAPTGTDYLVGDLWFDTSASKSGMPHRWNGTIWAQAFVTINGGLITADSITANSILIGDLFSKNISITGALKAQQEDNASNFVQLSGSGILAQQGGITKFSIPLDGDPTFTGVITNTTVDLWTTILRTNPNVQGNGGLIVDDEGIRAYNGDDANPTVSIFATGAASFAGNIEALSGNLGNLNVTGNLALNGGKIIFGSTLEISSTQIKFGDTSISNIGLVSGDTRVFNGGMLIGTTTQFGLGECNLGRDIVNTVRLSNTSGGLLIQSTNTIKINGTTCVASYTGNPTSITVNNGLITAIS